MRRLVLVVAVMGALNSTGCAFMFKGSKQKVRFVSVPETADVRVDNRYLGATPVEGELDRNQSQNVLVSKERFGDQHVQVRRHPDTAWWFWDIGTCAVPVTLCIPLLFDALSGAWFSLDEDVRVKLDAVPTGASAVHTPPAVDPQPLPAETKSSGSEAGP